MLELIASILGDGLVGKGIRGFIATMQFCYLMWLLAGTPGTVSWLLAPVVFVVPWVFWRLWRRRSREVR